MRMLPFFKTELPEDKPIWQVGCKNCQALESEITKLKERGGEAEKLLTIALKALRPYSAEWHNLQNTEYATRPMFKTRMNKLRNADKAFDNITAFLAESPTPDKGGVDG